MKNFILFIKTRLKFDRNELSGAFGDVGTVVPLIVGLLMVTGMDGARVFIAFGLMQVLTAVVYGIPMPVQPLKVAAIIVITQKLSGGVLAGGGLAIGIAMFLMSISGLIDLLGKIIPKTVVRGIQLGLGLQLSMLAIREYIPSASTPGYVLAGLGFAIIIPLVGNRRLPPALPVILLGLPFRCP
jgi:hypothetical protein